MSLVKKNPSSSHIKDSWPTVSLLPLQASMWIFVFQLHSDWVYSGVKWPLIITISVAQYIVWQNDINSVIIESSIKVH